MLTDKKDMYDMCCWMKSNVVIKQPVYKCIGWDYIEGIDCRIWDRMDKMSHESTLISADGILEHLSDII